MARRARADVGLRADFLAEAGRLLWPEPTRLVVGVDGLRDSPAPVSDFVLVPGAARPRLLVPGRPRRVAAGAVRRYTVPSSSVARLRLQVLSLLLGAGVGQRVLRARACVYAGPGGEAPDTIETYLRGVLGSRLYVSLHIGPARANRKPVLQLLDPDGETRGFAKVGVNDLTDRLVRAEARSLGLLAAAPFDALVVPPLLHHGRWHGHEVLVQGALPTWRRTTTRRPELLRAMRELALTRGTWTEPVGGGDRGTGYGARLRREVAGLHDPTMRAALGGVLEDLAPTASATAVTLGSWHGDWTPWNMAAYGDRVMVWDWERFATGVPLGFDAVHYDVQQAVTRGGVAPRAAVHHALARSPRTLAPFGLAPAQARLVASLYLVELAVRYLGDGQAEAGARLGRLGQWLLPALVEQARSLRAAAS
jgi:hypothetical protein